MKTKHLLTGLVLPALLAACTAEEIVEQQAVVKNDLAARPVVGKVTLSTGDVDSRATVGEGWNSLSFEEGDKIGARVMDVYAPYAGTSCDEDEDCAVCTNPYWNYRIDNSFASSNYQYTNDGSDNWETDALMVEGNYMFYFPYNEKFLERGPVKFTLPLKQNVNAVNEDNQPVKDLFEGENPFLVAYNFLPAEGQDPILGLDFQHVFAYPMITLKNTYKETVEGSSKPVGKEITVDKIIITSNSGLIKDEGTIKHQGLADALNNYLIDACDNEYHEAKEAGSWVTLNEDGRLKKRTYKKYITTATSDDIVDYSNGEVSFITVDIEDVTLQPDETFSFYVVMPALQFAENDLNMKVYLANNKMFEDAFAFETLNDHITFVPGKRYPREEYNYESGKEATATPKTTAGKLSTFDLKGDIVDAVLPIKPISNIDEFEAMLDEVADNTDVLKEGTNAQVNAGEAQFSLATDKDGKVFLEIDDDLMALLDKYLADGSIEFTSPMVVKASALDKIKFENVTFASENLTVKNDVKAAAVTIESGKVTVSNTADKSLGTVTVNAGELVIAKDNFLDETAVVVAETLDEEEQVAAGTLTISAANSLDNVTMKVDADVVINAAVTVEVDNITAGTITNNSTITLDADWTIAEDVTFDNKGKIAGSGDLNNAGTITTTKNLDVDENNGLIKVMSAAVTLNVAAGEGKVDNTKAGMVSVTANTVYAELDEITSIRADINEAYDDASGVTKIVATGTWSARTNDERLDERFTEVEFKGASLSMASVTMDLNMAAVTISANTTWTGRGNESVVKCKALKYGMYDTNNDNIDDTYYTLTVDKVTVKDVNDNTINVNEIALTQAAENGGTVTLTGDVVLTETINFAKTATLDLNGKKIVNQKTNTSTDVIKVTAGTLTINGNGIIEAVSGNDGYTVFVDGATAKVVINGGTFKVGHDQNGDGNVAVYTKNGGEAEIIAGYFEHTGNPSNDFSTPQYPLVNENDPNRDTITVKGGTFKNFNPANNYSEGDNTSFLPATGYKVTAKNLTTNLPVAAGNETKAYDTKWIDDVEYTVSAITPAQ